jgi:hypothetical protein
VFNCLISLTVSGQSRRGILPSDVPHFTME